MVYFPRKNYLNEPTKLSHIDSLRGLAIILVIVCHVADQSDIEPINRFRLMFGQIGVQLFFFLSAYTLCLSISERHNKNRIRNFYLRRFFRIAPLYYAGILIYFIVSKIAFLNQGGFLLLYPHFTKSIVLANILFLHGLIKSAYNYTVPGGWSIGTEMLFYLIFPAIFTLFANLKKWQIYAMPLVALLTANLYMIIGYLFVKSEVFSNHFYYAFILNQLPVFIVGVSYFFLEKTKWLNSSTLVSMAVFLFFFVLSFLFWEKLKYNINLAIFTSSISFMFLFNFFKKIKQKLAALQRIGQLSYSIYVIHFIFAYNLASKVRTVMLQLNLAGYVVMLINLVITFSLSILLAFILERLIEKPGIKLGKLLIQKLDI